MDIYLLILILGFSYAVIFGLLSFLRREGISMQFTLETVAITVAIAGGCYLTGSVVNPILFLIFLYLITMRCRLLTDLANFLSNRGRQRDAMAVLQVAMRLFPDKQSRLIVLVNMGIVQLLRKSPESAEAILQSAVEQSKAGGLGLRHRAALHYNLGIALRDQGKDAQSVKHFREATDVFPGTPYGKAAQIALEQRRKGKKKGDKPPEANDQS